MSENSSSPKFGKDKKKSATENSADWKLIIKKYTSQRTSTSANPADKTDARNNTSAANTQDPGDKQSTGLLVLFVFPYLLSVLFVLSFFWDFDGIVFHLPFFSLSAEGLVRTLSVAGLIGFLTNWLAIQMLFYPRKKRPVLGQGLIPAQKDKIALRLSAAVERELINPELIKREFIESGILDHYINRSIRGLYDTMQQQDFRADVDALARKYIRQTLENESVIQKLVQESEAIIRKRTESNSVEKSALKLYLLLKGKTLDELLRGIISSLPESVDEAAIPFHGIVSKLPAQLRSERAGFHELILSLLEKVVDEIKIGKIIQENLHRYDEVKLEKIIRSTTDSQLRYIKYLGAVIGTIGGLVIWSPIPALILLSAITGIVFLTDRILQPASD
ncbi:MAG: DUF445 domain-containing protein [Balneolales bacterium]|nr:DUF445 domain-containing protein [Balneolales bacterium]